MVCLSYIVSFISKHVLDQIYCMWNWVNTSRWSPITCYSWSCVPYHMLQLELLTPCRYKVNSNGYKQGHVSAKNALYLAKQNLWFIKNRMIYMQNICLTFRKTWFPIIFSIYKLTLISLHMKTCIIWENCVSPVIKTHIGFLMIVIFIVLQPLWRWQPFRDAYVCWIGDNQNYLAKSNTIT